MSPVKVALVGAGSRSFGSATITDVLLSDVLAEAGLRLVLMDVEAAHLPPVLARARLLAERLGRGAEVTATTDLDEAVDGASFVVTAIEVDRFRYWAQDFHVPRKYGFRQVFGENGGPGGLFHALRNMGPTVAIARAMERGCPDAFLLNFTNPEHKLVEAVSRLTSIRAVGLCHGYFMGLHQAARMLEMPADRLDAAACGINHFTWFTRLRDAQTGEDLYPRLRAAEREGDWLHDWHEIGLGRVLFRTYGLWPSPAANHYGEYLAWADEFVASELQFFHDPVDGPPWNQDPLPEWLYSLTGDVTGRPWRRPPHADPEPPSGDLPLKPSGELAVPLMDAVVSGVERTLEAVNVPNRGAIANLPADAVVEVPALAGAGGLAPVVMPELPEGIAALLARQASINKLLVQAYAEGSRGALLQALLLDPTVNSYRQAVAMMDEMIALQAGILPPLS